MMNDGVIMMSDNVKMMSDGAIMMSDNDFMTDDHATMMGNNDFMTDDGAIMMGDGGYMMGGCWVWWVREGNEKKICLKNANGLQRLSIPIAIGIKTWKVGV